MKILFDHQAFDMQHFGGVSNCFVKLISNFPKEVRFEISLQESDNVHLRNSGLVDVKSANLSPENFIMNSHFLGQGILYGWYSKLFPSKTTYGRNRLCSIDKLKKGDYDVFHPTFFNPYFLNYLNGKPFVLTVHDMIPELFSKKDSQVIHKSILCQKAAHIIAVSKKTKSDLIDMLGVPEEKITVVYHGAPDTHDISSLPLFKGRYILYVGGRLGYKNFNQMVNSLAPLLHRHKDINIVCTGVEFSQKEKKMFRNLRVEERMFHFRASDSELQNLYCHALCFIYPSIYEGFGIPILEAYSAHCPVLLNYKSCFPEIAKDAAIYFNLDNNSSNIEDVMEKFLSMNSEEKEVLMQKQQDRLLMYSWKSSANKLAEIYTKVIEK